MLKIAAIVVILEALHGIALADCGSQRGFCVTGCRAVPPLFARDCQRRCAEQYQECRKAEAAPAARSAPPARRDATPTPRQEVYESTVRYAASSPATATPSASGPEAGAVAQSSSAPSVVVPLSAIQQCDQFGAHVDDPEAFAKGVPDDQLVPDEVIKACEAALQQDQDTPRLAFQLARGYLKANRTNDAVEQLVAASKLGHGAALAYLADIYLDGAKDIDPDPATAHELYLRAVASGFEPARAILAKFEDYTDQYTVAEKEERQLGSTLNVPSIAYINPDIIKNIMDYKLDDVPGGEIWVKKYLIEIAENIEQECSAHPSAAKIEALKMSSVAASWNPSKDFAISRIQNIAEEVARSQALLREVGPFVAPIIEAQRKIQAEIDYDEAFDSAMREGINDSFALMMQYPCGSYEIDAFVSKMTDYITSKGLRHFSLDELQAACKKTVKTGLTKYMDDRCRCISRQFLTSLPLTRGERKNLQSDFGEIFSRMNNEYPQVFENCRFK